MRKIVLILAAFAALAVVSCTKEADQAAPQKVYKLTATIENDTPAVAAVKTTYDADGKFGWVAGDNIRLIVYHKTAKNVDHNAFAAESAGASSNFTAIADPHWDTYARSGYAYYPTSLGETGNPDAGTYSIVLPAEYTVTSDFTSIIPLIGKEKSVDAMDYTFKTAVGVLKVTLTNVPVEARKLVLKTTNAVAGTFALDYTNGLLMSAAAAGATNNITVNFPQQTAGSTVAVYIPVPVGTISAGATLEVQNSSGTAIKTTAATVKDIEIFRNKVLPLPSISVEDWTLVGTGKYMDDHGFYWLGGPDGRTADDYVNVTIQQHATETNRYRISSPYASCPSASTKIPNAADYLYIDLRPDLGTDMLVNHSYKYNNGSSTMFDGPVWGYSSNYFNSRIIRKDGSGNPANIQLAEKYFAFNGEYSESNCDENPKIEIVFPGSTPMLANVFGYAAGASATYSDGNVNVTISNANITAVKVKAAASISAGVEALLAGEEDLTFDATGTKALALTEGQQYYLIYKIETDGHGYTFKNGGSFAANNLPAVTLTSSMLTVSTDATYNGGTTYDGNGYASLVDGSVSTFWHSAYGSQAGDDYDWADLDPTYGAFIDVALESPLKTFRLWYYTRPNGDNSSPRAIIFAVSTNGTEWTTVNTVEEDFMNVGRGQRVVLPELVASSSFSYLRIGIIKSGLTPSILTDPKGGSTAIAELYLFGKNE